MIIRKKTFRREVNDEYKIDEYNNSDDDVEHQSSDENNTKNEIHNEIENESKINKGKQ